MTNRHEVEANDRLESWKAAAHAEGVEAAKIAAQWVADGNSDRAALERLRLQLDEGDPAAEQYLPPRPNLSGEWADSMSPRILFESVTGLDAHAEASFNVDAYNEVLELLCDAWDEGVSETFEPAIGAELARWLD